MPTDYTTLAIAINRDTKEPTCSGTVAVKEMVKLTITGGAQYIADGLVLKIQGKNNKGLTTPIALFPLVDPPNGYTNTWTATGDDDADAMCYLNLNTAEAVEAFASVGNLAFKPFNLVIMTTAAPALDANGVIEIGQFPSGLTGDPITLAEAAVIANLVDDVTELKAQAAVTPVFSDFTDILLMPLTNDRERTAVITAMLNKLAGVT